MSLSNTAIESRFVDRTATIGIIGMGYVGMPLALAASDAGFKIIGFDVDPKKVASIKAGKSYIGHIGSEAIAAAVALWTAVRHRPL